MHTPSTVLRYSNSIESNVCCKNIKYINVFLFVQYCLRYREYFDYGFYFVLFSRGQTRCRFIFCLVSLVVAKDFGLGLLNRKKKKLPEEILYTRRPAASRAQYTAVQSQPQRHVVIGGQGRHVRRKCTKCVLKMQSVSAAALGRELLISDAEP